METKKQIYIISSTFVLTIFFLLLFLVFPILNDIKQNSKDFANQKNSTYVLADEFDQAKEFQTNNKNFSVELDAINNIFVDSKNPVKFIQFLEKMASESNVSMEISKPYFVKEKSILIAFLQLSVVGDFSSILKFTAIVESGNYLVKLQDLSIQKYKSNNSDNAEQDMLRAEMVTKALAN